MLFIEQGDLSSAEKVCRAAIKLETLEKIDNRDYRYDDYCAYCSHGDCLRAKNDFNGACEAYENALERKPIDASSLISFADCLLEVSSSKSEVSRERLLKKAAMSLEKSIARKVVDLESTEAAEGPKYLAGNERFVLERAGLYIQLSDCLSDLKDYSGAKVVST